MGVAFPVQDGTDAAQVLVSELIKAPEGARPNKTVEPVQLQVVCTDLWNTLSQTERQVCEVRVADVTGYNPTMPYWIIAPRRSIWRRKVPIDSERWEIG